MNLDNYSTYPQGAVSIFDRSFEKALSSSRILDHSKINAMSEGPSRKFILRKNGEVKFSEIRFPGIFRR